MGVAGMGEALPSEAGWGRFGRMDIVGQGWSSGTSLNLWNAFAQAQGVIIQQSLCVRTTSTETPALGFRWRWRTGL